MHLHLLAEITYSRTAFRVDASASTVGGAERACLQWVSEKLTLIRE